ncbi:DUF3667 domain-containing protein [Dysgonomonas sp. Marseille-P4677]|uniref:DUF3667 domain-containing protein n=1 Tax=Dysgonomonas sp. Marseille-P4677 TaxID=2364790 RepID=UPI0019139986|nr:DUF3667 domain-containing protein [Dysgonomonas sp. Marseille-P4677]MBK5719430.1 DUF3667 domain-containing protein [Dysgonomonas sp. Marseille-P4677]
MNKESSCICKNCNNPVDNNYCGFCGQSAKTGRINLHYFIHEIQHSLLHIDKGILYTTKELLIRPGVTIREYLNGKRVNHFKPFAFVIILGTIYTFVAHFFNLYPENEIITFELSNHQEVANINKVIIDWIYSHYSLIMLSLIPFSAIASYIIFRKKGYNYPEHIIIYSYITGIQILLLLIAYPLYYFLHFTSTYYIILSLSFIYNIIVLVLLFKDRSWFITTLKALLSIMLSTTFIFIVSIIISILVALSKYG